MERLTKRSTVDKEMVWFVDKENEDFNLEPCEMDSHHSRLAIYKLAAYEDTELTPEQIVEMDRLYREKCEELARLDGFALVSENDRLRRRNASLEIQVKKLEEELKAKENS